jgi:hypothetical protein
MVGGVFGVASNIFADGAELIAHPKMRSVPINLAELVIVHHRSYICIPVARMSQSDKNVGRKLEGEDRVKRTW